LEACSAHGPVNPFYTSAMIARKVNGVFGTGWFALKPPLEFEPLT